ncbi:MAG: hypothetical protein ABI402_01915 [Ferruginibacter sp.]
MEMYNTHNSKRKILPIILFIFLLTGTTCESNAQSEWRILGDIDSHTCNNSISSIVKDHLGNIYAMLGAGVYKYDGIRWTELGKNGNTLRYGKAGIVTVDSSGNIYASAVIPNVSPDPGNWDYFIAKYNGTSWVRLPVVGTGYDFSALCTDANGNLFASRDQTIYKWNGSAWTMIFTSSTGTATSMACDGTGKLYATGNFTNASGNTFVNVWDGVSWTELGANVGSGNIYGGIVITDGQNNIYTKAYFGNGDGYGVAKWNGVSWNQLGTGATALNANGAIIALTIDAQYNIYAAGDLQNSSNKKIVAKWNGSSWSQLGVGANGINTIRTVHALIIDNAGNICASVDNLNDSSAFLKDSYIARWNGTNWLNELGGTTAALHAGNGVDIMLDEADNVYMVATFPYDVYAGGPTKQNISKWNGTTWSETIPGIDSNVISRLIKDGNGNFYITGQWADAAGNRYVRKWNGSTWAEVGSGASALNANGYIDALLIDHQNNVYAAGEFQNNNFKFYVAKWDGNTWAELGSGANALNANGSIYALTIDHAGNIYAGGYFTNASGRQYVAKWNGTSWSELGTGSAALNAHSNILSLTADVAGNIYVAGLANTLGRGYIAKWNGTNWSELGSGSNSLNVCDNSVIGQVFADSIGNIYAAGCFTDATQSFFKIAKWDGTTWTLTGTVNDDINYEFLYNNEVYAMASDISGTLYAAGSILDSRGYYHVAKLVNVRTYTFTGNGNWNDPANWTNNSIPPTTLPEGSTIMINPIPGGQCTLNNVQTIAPNATFTVAGGAHFVVTGNLIINESE